MVKENNIHENTEYCSISEDSKDDINVEVYCRIKPCNVKEEEKCIKINNSKSLSVITPLSKISGNGIRQELVCNLKNILLEDCTQKDVFEITANDMVTNLVNGNNGLIFTYGITGSGKTYTLYGNSSDPGILSRCITNVYNSVKNNLKGNENIHIDKYGKIEIIHDNKFNLNTPKINKRNNTICETPAILKENIINEQIESNIICGIFISMIEIYQNNIYDLFDEQLDHTNCPKTPASRSLRENSNGSTFIYGLTYESVHSISEALTYFRKGKKRRKVAETLLNTQSSRSHCVFTIYLVQMEKRNDGNMSGIISQLSLCDLAGSERLYRTLNEGDRQKESSSINSSLMTLRTCIEVMRENQKLKHKHSQLKLVPYRENRLTFMFRNYFEGDGKIRMILCINPISDDFNENLHVIRFAEITQEIKIKQEPISNKKQQLTTTNDNILLESSNNKPIELCHFPPFPSTQLKSYNDVQVLPNLVTYLLKCDKIRTGLSRELAKLCETVVRDIAIIEQENIQFKSKKTKLYSKVQELERENSQLKHSHKINKSKLNELEESNKKIQIEYTSIKSELEVLKQKYNTERSTRHILKRKLKEYQSHENHRVEKECAIRVHEATEEIKNKLYQHDQKIKIVQDVLHNTSRLPPITTDNSSPPQIPRSRKRKSGSNHRI